MTEQVSYFYVAGWDEATPETRDILTKGAMQNAPGKVIEGRDARELEQSPALSERQFSEAWGDLQQFDELATGINERQSVIDSQKAAMTAMQAKIDFLTQPPAPVPAQSIATPEPVQAVAVSVGPAIPKNKRPDLLTPLIERAQRGEADPFNAAVIWPKLRDMAERKTTPLIGVAPEGIKWTDGNDSVQFLTKKALSDRLRRLKKSR
jgi:hypothetical protein